ncbi:MAG TPA: PepSY-like domain-containing protein [Chitinophagaceae bacterium]
MKSLAFILLTGAFAGTVISCNDNKTETATNTNQDSATVVTPQPVDETATITVPDKTRTTFEKKYTGATNVTWTRQNRNTAVTTSPDSMDYQVVYRWNDMDYTTWYDWNGDWIVTTAKISNDKLPAAVNKVINSKYPGFTITEVDMENDKNMTSYKVDLEKGTEKKTIHFSPEGKELKSKSKTK